MSTLVVGGPVYRETEGDTYESVPATKRVVVGYGFWIFLLSDIVMFSAFFAAYAVLAHATAGGPDGMQLFSQRSVAIETVCLLASSYTCGLMQLAVTARRYAVTYGMAILTFLLGALFLAEVHRMHLRAVRGSEVQTMRLFHESNIYLTLLFAALAVDALIH